MEFAKCEDRSDDEDPKTECVCQMGKIFDKTGTICEDPPPPTPTPRPIPTMAAEVKAVTSGMQKTASTLLIIFVSITLALFMVLRIFNTARVIQMNIELSLISAHLLLLYGGDPEMVIPCKIISFLIHLFHVTCFVFMFLEALYTYRYETYITSDQLSIIIISLVAYVVKKDGLLTKAQNVIVGWGTGVGITMVVLSLEWKNYGGETICTRQSCMIITVAR